MGSGREEEESRFAGGEEVRARDVFKRTAARSSNRMSAPFIPFGNSKYLFRSKSKYLLVNKYYTNMSNWLFLFSRYIISKVIDSDAINQPYDQLCDFCSSVNSPKDNISRWIDGSIICVTFLRLKYGCSVFVLKDLLPNHVLKETCPQYVAPNSVRGSDTRWWKA